jgi:hypothetical protein
MMQSDYGESLHIRNRLPGTETFMPVGFDHLTKLLAFAILVEELARKERKTDAKSN